MVTSNRFIYTYRAFEEERMEIAYLTKVPAMDAVRWLELHEPTPEMNRSIFGIDDKRRLVEFLLSRRNEPLIDWGIARYGCSRKAVQKAFDRGGVGTKIAAVANPRGSIWLKQCDDILRHGKWPFLRAMLGNPYLPSEFLEDMLCRKSRFSDISDDRFALIVQALTGNKRLNRPHDSIYIDGFEEYQYGQVSVAAWNLTKSVPANDRWAGILWNLLGKCERAFKFDDLEQTIERWRIDKEPKHNPPRWFDRSSSFHVRTLLAGFMKADEVLLHSEDPALRMSFYQRFLPQQFRNWPEFLDKDGEEFVHAAMDNEYLWSSHTERERLSEVCWKCPDPHSTMDIPNDFRGQKERRKKEHPAWFAEEEGITNVSEDGRLRSIEENLSTLVESLSEIRPHSPVVAKSPMSLLASVPWWAWLLVGVLLSSVAQRH